jgi:hypothetical protein
MAEDELTNLVKSEIDKELEKKSHYFGGEELPEGVKRSTARKVIKKCLADVQVAEKEYQAYPKTPALWKLAIFPAEHSFHKVFDFLMDQRLYDSEELVQYLPRMTGFRRIEQGFNQGKAVKRKLVLLTVNYQHMARATGLSVSQCRKYVQEFTRIRILDKLGRQGKNGPNIYAVGWWVEVKDFIKRVSFLCNTREWEAKLKSMRFRW